ncbi:hypothetical protein [Crocosphaera sp. Alani8]|uniref:hypothetical protein n=1 Tax=Crocosphaera sp. Alani8 TaxID=3038952 RepID=UPI00313BEFB4
MTRKEKSEVKFPPIVPGAKEELEQAIMLLGNRVQGELNKKNKKRLIKLVGEYPSIETAHQWKTSLKQILKRIPLPTPGPEVEPNVTYSGSLKRKHYIDQFEVVSGTFGETKIILEYLKYKLQDYYLDDEQCYDERFLKQLRYWYQWFPYNVREREFSKKILEVCLAEELSEDSFYFDYREYKYDMSRQRITADDAPEFAEPLLRWALSKVDWKLLTKQLLKMFNMENAEKFNNKLIKRGYE